MAGQNGQPGCSAKQKLPDRQAKAEGGEVAVQFRCKISESDLAERIRALGAHISKDYKDQELTVVCVLKGSFIFAADLIRALSCPVQIEFIGVSSYQGTTSTGHVRITHDLGSEIKGKHILVVEDIIDTGITIDYLMNLLKVREPASLKICTLLFKPQCQKMKHHIDYIGYEIGDDFVIGFGLDLDGHYRQLPYVAQVIES